MVADLHSLTTHPDTKELKANVHRVLAENIASGLDPDKVALYCQSQVHETSELYLYLNMMAYKGELEKTTTFKEKVRLSPDNVNAGLLTYPVLQTADILLHGQNMSLLVKTRNNTLKWPGHLQTDLITVMEKFFPNPRLLIITKV
jgi:tryptophanyl-tRNA synthetase